MITMHRHTRGVIATARETRESVAEAGRQKGSGHMAR